MDISVPRGTFDCAVCCQTFTDPKNLHCGHVFCLECIQKLQLGRKIPCPLCRKETRLERFKTPADLGTPIIVKDLQEHLGNVSDKKHNNDSLFFCTTHPKKHASRYCRPCGKIVCDRCASSDHAGHDICAVEDVWEETIDNLEKFGIRQQLEPTPKQLESARAEIENPNFSPVLDEIEREIVKLHRQVDIIMNDGAAFTEEQTAQWRNITKRIKHNKSVIELARDIKGSLGKSGQSLIEMKRLLDSYICDKQDTQFYPYCKLVPSVDWASILFEVRVLQGRINVQVDRRRLPLNREKSTSAPLPTLGVEANNNTIHPWSTAPTMRPLTRNQRPPVDARGRKRNADHLTSTDLWSDAAHDVYAQMRVQHAEYMFAGDNGD